eukprot:gene33473-40500_t
MSRSDMEGKYGVSEDMSQKETDVEYLSSTEGLVDDDENSEPDPDMGVNQSLALKAHFDSMQSMSVFPAKKNLLFSHVIMTEETVGLLPLITLLERVNSKQCYFDIFRAFEIWKREFGHPPSARAILTTPHVKYESVYDFGPSPRVFYEQPKAIKNSKTGKALHVIANGMKKLRAMQNDPLKTQMWRRFNHWKKWSQGCHRVSSLIPVPLRILIMLHHSVLWRIFYSYSATHRPVTMSILTLASPNADGQAAYNSPTRSPDKSSAGRPFPFKQYAQKAVKPNEIWTIFRDLAICPLHLGRWKFDHLLRSLRKQQSLQLMDKRDSLLFYERSPIKRGGSRLGPGSPNPYGSGLGLSESSSGHFNGHHSGTSASSAGALERSGGSSGGGWTTAGQSNDDSVSFDVFMKFLWRIVAELLEMPDMNMATAIPAIRQVLKSLENNAIAFSIRLINNGGWDRFITQYKERQPDIHTQNKLFR